MFTKPASRSDFIKICSVLLCLAGSPVASLGDAGIRLTGDDFKGSDTARHVFPGRQSVAFVYSQESKKSSLRAAFNLSQSGDVFYVYVNGRYYRSAKQSHLRFLINGKSFYEGNERFVNDMWTWQSFEVSSESLNETDNTLTIENIERDGLFASSDSFQICQCVISTEPVNPAVFAANPLTQFSFNLATGKPLLPAPLHPDHPAPGFKLRGLKGWNYSYQDYVAVIPFMVENKMNFLMNCYLSLFPRTERMSRFENCLIPYDNNWWEDISEEQKAQYKELVRLCNESGIIFCFSMNPNYQSTRPFDYKSESDFNSMLKHYLWAQSIGVKWFNVSFDDIKTGIDPEGQAKSVTRLLDILRVKDPDAQMIFCPTYYRLTAKNIVKEREYLHALNEYLPKDIYVFWTGGAKNRTVTKDEAQTFKDLVGRRMIFWDNYPVNNASQTISLGPVIGRDAGIAEIADGYMANPMWPQVSLNRLPLMTAADYAYNPWNYDPKRSIATAVSKLTENPDQAGTLRELIYLYPGKILHNKESGFNPFVDKFNQITKIEHSEFIAKIYIRHAENVLDKMNAHFDPVVFWDAQETLRNDIDAIKQTYYFTYGNAYEATIRAEKAP